MVKRRIVHAVAQLVLGPTGIAARSGIFDTYVGVAVPSPRLAVGETRAGGSAPATTKRRITVVRCLFRRRPPFPAARVRGRQR